LGKSLGLNILPEQKRGEQFSPLFLYIIFIVLLHGYATMQPISKKLFPNIINSNKDVQESSGYSFHTFYNHAYKHTINDTTTTHIYHAKSVQSFTLPLKNNSVLKLGHAYSNHYAGYKDYEQKQHLYNKQLIHELNLNYKYGADWYKINLNYKSAPSIQYEDRAIDVILNYKGFIFQTNYQTFRKTSTGYFLSDTMQFEVNNFLDFTSNTISGGYDGEKFSAIISKTSRVPSDKENIKNVGLVLFTTPDREQVNSSVSYKVNEKFTIWGQSFNQKDTSETPIIWSDRKLGEFTALDDSLWSARIGINFNNHQIAYGKGHTKGHIWVSQFSPSPFLNVWTSLTGTKYYLDVGNDLNFSSLFYSYHFKKGKWESALQVNSFNFAGSINAEQWAITFPFILTVHDKLSIQIHALNIIESKMEISKQISSAIKVKFWTNSLLPVKGDITVKPKLPEKPPEEKEKEKVSGGLQFGLSLGYYFK